MKKVLVIMAVLAMAATAAQAAVLLSWAFTSSVIASQVAGSIGANLDTGGGFNDMTRGATAGSSVGASSFRTLGFKNEGISTANTDYFQFTLSAAAGSSLSLTGLTATMVGTPGFYASPGVTDQWGYSLNGSTFSLIGSAVQQTILTRNWNFSGTAALQNVGPSTTVTLRYYASGQTTTGAFGFTGSGGALTALNGTTQAVPEPTTMALLGLGGLAMALRRKMKK